MLPLINTIDKATPDEWDSIWNNCDYSTYFHSREWAEIWNVYTKGKIRPEPKIISFSDEKKVLLPLSSEKLLNGLTNKYLMSPGINFGGWISKDDLGVQHGELLIEYIQKIGNFFWRLNPFDPVVFKLDINTNKDDETQVLFLYHDFDLAFKGWTKGHRSASNKAKNDGVKIRVASSIDDWKSYYCVYQDSLRRWGEKAAGRHNWEIFNEMFHRNSPYIKLWLAYFEDNIVAGAICFYSKKHVAYWHGAALERYFNIRPVNLLMYEAIKHACEHGYKWFDFNFSGGNKGVIAFKKSFGTVVLPCPVVLGETNFVKFSKSIINRYKGLTVGK